MNRLSAWAGLWLLGSVMFYLIELGRSQVAFDCGDRSAFAWHAFLPFVFPVFLLYSALVVAPLAAITEFYRSFK